MRVLAAALLVTASTAAAQPFDTIVAGNGGWCVVVLPVISRSLEFTGAATYQTNVAAVAPGPDGRVFAAVISGSGFIVAEIRPDRTISPLSAVVPNRTPFALVADRSGQIYVLAGHFHTVDHAVFAFAPDGNLRATFPLGGRYFWDQYFTHLAETAIDLAADQCTLFLIADGMLIRRFDVCTGQFLSDFALLAPNEAYALRVLPDGGLLIAGQDQAGYALTRFTSAGTVARRYPIDSYAHALMLRDGGARVVYGEQGCNYGELVTLDLATGRADTPRITMDTPTSIVSYFGWTAAIGASHLADAPTLSVGALAAVALALAGIALLRLR